MHRFLIALTLLFLSVTGCATGRRSTLAQAPLTPVMLYDNHAGWPTATAMGRSNWPSTTSYQRQAESVEYYEQFIDIQRAGPFSGRNQDYVYRRFSTRRTGRASR